MNMLLRPLRLDDAADLLAFEIANRAWFERIIPARDASFYTEAGILGHIETCLHELRQGTMYPATIVDADGKIAGRANLRFIDQAAGTGEIGYRIAQAHCSKGWASASVQYLQQAAYGELGLRRLEAYAAIENPGSVRVLEKNGFVRAELVPQRSMVGGRWLAAHRYEHTLV